MTQGTDSKPNAAQDNLARKNRKVALSVGLTVLAMVGLAYASVPLYDLFCRVTGFGGTTQVAQSLPDHVIDREITVQFDANTAPHLNWVFKPEQRKITVKLGERGLAAFYAQNKSDVPVAGTAVFNVTPLKAGKYFQKIECFCFGEQILQPHEEVHMPVLFFIDPAMHDDPALDDVKVITLSYSYFKTDSKELEAAMDAFYESQ